ncbi:protein polyglycylase TTLL10 [Osmerus eperlanus]|uniref:protein polyglycylase TTLL10 n=1 Tax=Osmerus eperlanus TaxID=29151 RepID=UPI002E12478A
MSSENLDEASPRGELEVRGQQPEHKERACGNTQPSDKQSQEGSQEDLREESGSSAHRETQEVTSDRQVQEEDRRTCPEETQERSVRSPEQETENQDGGPGVCLEERCPSAGKLGVSARGVVPLSYPERERERRVEEPRGHGPFYFFGGANGAAIVTSYCESKGWQRISDKHREDFKLKWCETKSVATYYNFREGEQLIYQIPNNKVLTTKIGLLNSLREYDRVSSKVNHGRGLRRLKMEEFFPATFRMDVRDEREAFFSQQEGVHGEDISMWICKPTGLNQGRGIFLLQSREDISAFRLKLQSNAESQCNKKIPVRVPQARIVQRYVTNPLLLKGRKFDVRSYFLIACTRPYMVFFRHGYVRLTCELYDPNSNNLSAHLTNQYMQKKNPLYSVLKEETVWSMERFNTYVNEKFKDTKGLPDDWVLGVFTKRMQQIMIQCFFAVKAKLERKLGYFDLIGCDFMVDEDFKVWLLEMNCNPALHTNCEVLKEVVPSTVVETLDMTLEIFNKCRGGLKIVPLASQKNFILLYDGETPPLPAVTRPIKPSGLTRRLESVPQQKPVNKTPTGEPLVSQRSWRGVNKMQDPPATVSHAQPITDSSSTLVVATAAVVSSSTASSSTASSSTASSSTASSSTASSSTASSSTASSSTASSSTASSRTSSTTNVVLRPHPSPKASEAPRSAPRPQKPAHARVELPLRKCTWLGRAGSPKRLHGAPELRSMKSMITSLSTSALSDASGRSLRRVGVIKARPGSDLGQALSCAIKPTRLRLAPPGPGQPVWTVDSVEKKKEEEEPLRTNRASAKS